MLASALAAYTDWKTGYIYDKITYPLIAIGLLLNVVEQQWLGLGIGAAVFLIGYAFYFAGKIGGGDVKLFSGTALVLPLYGKGIFILNALLVSAVLSVVFFTIYFAGKYLLKKGFNLKENRQGITNAVLVGAFLVLYFFFILQMNVLSPYSIMFLAVPLLFGLAYVALEKGIRKEFFLQKTKLEKLEEDELLAVEFEEKKTLDLLDLKLKGVLGKKEIEKLEKAGIKEVLVYRNVPRFAPFFFLGCLAAMAFPDLLQLFFLKL